jgi:hypothetical protein
MSERVPFIAVNPLDHYAISPFTDKNAPLAGFIRIPANKTL